MLPCPILRFNMWAKYKQSNGFTIVELLIVIVVIGILAAITIVAYNGVQQRAENNKTIGAVNQSVKLLRLYKELNGSYPSTSPGYACFGTGYSNGICFTQADGVSPAAQEQAAFNSALQTVGSIPNASTIPLLTSTGSIVAGASFENGSGMIRYHLNGASQPCNAGGTGFNYGNVTQCRIVLN
jgi:prepilin-type N-terminal cleavage/methylation domain-containing protein